MRSGSPVLSSSTSRIEISVPGAERDGLPFVFRLDGAFQPRVAKLAGTAYHKDAAYKHPVPSFASPVFSANDQIGYEYLH